MKTNITALKSRYGKTDINEEYLRYPLNGPIKYEEDYTGTYSKYALVDKYYVDSLVKPHKRLISGGAEFSSLGNSLSFTLSDLYYTFTGKILSSSASNTTYNVDPGSSLPRIDAIVMNEPDQISVVKGTPAAIPTRPPISDNQILIQYVYVAALATTIGTSELIYSNNGQWTVTNYQLGGLQSGTYDPAFTGDDYLSGSCVELNTDFRTGVKFTYPLGLGPSASNFGSLSMRIKFISTVPDERSLFAQIQGTANGATVYGNTVNLMTYGLQRNIVNTWQHVVVPTSKFGYDMSNYQALTLRMAGGATMSNVLFRADYILLQRGSTFDGYMGEPDTAGSAGTSNAVAGNVIGPAEDGTYTDGVFTDFNVNTPIGTAVDRFNELFLALVPAPAPSLSTWSANSRASGTTGKLSFSTAQPIAEGTYVGADTAPSNPVGVDGQWGATGNRLALFATSNTAPFTGDLASGTVADPNQSPTPAYVAKSFGEATTGNVTLSINGVIVSTASVSTITGPIDTTSGGASSGLVLSAATGSRFSSGKLFETSNSLFLSRTGTWRVNYNDPRIVNGYNFVVAEHKSASFTRTLTRFEWVQDANTVETTFNNFEITSFSFTSPKYLSGIQYYTGGSISYDGTMSNLYRNTYYPSGDAVTFLDLGSAGNAGTTPHLNVSAQYPLVANGGNELKNVRLSTDFNGSSPLTFNLLSSGKRRLNDPIGVRTNAKRTLQGNRTGGTSSISNVYLDNQAENATDYVEYFNGESYRLKGETAGLSYSLSTDITSNPWSSTYSLIGTDANHNTGLMVYNSRLYYPTQVTPTADFTTPGSLATNPNFGISDRNYTSAIGTRTYIRYFRQVAPIKANYMITLTGASTTFVADTTPLSGNNAWLHIKLPTGASAGTGWLDCYRPFDGAVASNTNWQVGGAFAASQGSGSPQQVLGGSWGLTTGSRGTSNSNGYVVIRLTVSSSWTGYIDDITFVFK